MSEKRVILVADDDPDQIFLLAHQLEQWGYAVVAVNSRREAESYLEQNCPDLAILDLMMEEEDSGFILAYRIKKCKPHVPVIISTAVAAERGISFQLESQTGERWIKADQYLEKGYRMSQLKEIIQNLLS